MSDSPKRIDLHCHSAASNRPTEAALNAIGCPESYSSPRQVYQQAKRRGMDFVTLTDHDTIDGAGEIADLPDVLMGEELTSWFPEDGCKLHLLVYGLTPQIHDALQTRAKNIYDIAAYIEENAIAHAVAHPIYRQNDKLERWHVERLLLLFKGFECLNGAHSGLHREAFEPLLERLSALEIARLSETHHLQPRWKEPWHKARVAGSDDHGLLNVGRTYTLFPAETKTPDDVLDCLRDGRCAPAGEAGSSAKLAHTFYSIAVRYYTREVMSPGAKPNLATTVLQTLAGERAAPKKRELIGLSLKHKLKKIGRKIVSPFSRGDRTSEGGVLKRLFLESAKKRIGGNQNLLIALAAGLPPLGEHADMLELASGINRDVTQGIAAAIADSVDRASFIGLFDSIAALLAQQFVLLPHYFAVFHQNKDRQLLRQLTGQERAADAKTMRVALFTDTLGEINGVARFIRDMKRQADSAGCKLEVHTCTNAAASTDISAALNFAPLLSRPLPLYSDLPLNLPPVLDILHWADQQQFDAIHVSTPGPMGLCGWLVSRMLRVPMLATYHTDFPAYVEKFTADHRMTAAGTAYMKWFYGQAATVFARSTAYRFKLLDLGIAAEKLHVLPAGVDTERFNPSHRDAATLWSLGVTQPRKILYAGRVSVEKNLALLTECFKTLRKQRTDVALIVAGDGPYLETMKRELVGLPAYFCGVADDQKLAALYASCDLFVFPSRTDTLGQVVVEAQACGLPAIVSGDGGPREIVADDVSGRVLSSDDVNNWVAAVSELLDDEPRRQRMSAAAVQRSSRFALSATFKLFWAEHLAAIQPPAGETAGSMQEPTSHDSKQAATL